MTKVNAHVKFM